MNRNSQSVSQSASQPAKATTPPVSIYTRKPPLLKLPNQPSISTITTSLRKHRHCFITFIHLLQSLNRFHFFHKSL
ncbi:hypothetical protein L6452_12629 [Arctium lappa]|uniref:Uncharacterized protein n=1 Tax=Arctium lappa TaxID=4217 RepID=A0ACB9DRH2_ARCLA|nr:hypothetical protein L6452_12629 [Arctium lappa]